MAYKDKLNYTTIAVKKESVKKLDQYKVHPNEPYWQIIRDLINEVESPEHDKQSIREVKENGNGITTEPRT